MIGLPLIESGFCLIQPSPMYSDNYLSPPGDNYLSPVKI